ncbi:recombinase family protein [Tunturiibacter gelidiferens]
MVRRATAHGQVIGYCRVSTLDQNTSRQLEGIELDRVFEDKLSGKDMNRPQLAALLKHVREGDTVVVHSLDRLGRNLDDLRKLVNDLTGRGVHVQFLKEALTFSGEDSAMAKLLLNVMGAFAEFERELIKERQREGIAIAKKNGVYKGRKPSLTAESIADIRKRVAAGAKKSALAAEYGVTRMTVYNALETAEGPQ